LSGAEGPQLMPRFTNVSNALALESLAAIEPLNAEVVLPGHGDPWFGTPADAVQHARDAHRN
jgi:hypothetical protein